jgi:hypothetical protein
MLKEKFVDDNNRTIYAYVGYEVEYFKLIAEALNMSILYEEVPPGKIQEIYMKTVGDVAYGMSDISFGGYPLHSLFMHILDPAIPYAKEYLKWYIPCGKPIPREKKVTAIFTPHLWVTVFCVFISVAVVMWQLSVRTQPFQLDSRSFRAISVCLYNVWAVSMGVPVSEMPRSYSIRLMFLCFVWYCFALRTLFQICFTSILVNPGTSDQIRTIEELYRSDLVYVSNKEMNLFLQYTLSDFYQGIRLRKKKELSDWDASMTEYLDSQNGATVSFSALTEYAILSSVPSGSEAPQLCTLREDIYEIDLTMYFKKGSPLLGRFNVIIRRLIETGLILKSTKDFKASFKYTNWSPNLKLPNRVGRDDHGYIVFSLYHLKVIFWVPVMGYVMSCVIFAGELLYCHLFK